jgi:hypothetical protein
MKRLLIPIILILLINSQFVSAQPELNLLRLKFQTFGKYYIPPDSIKETWMGSRVKFNDACDTIFFQGVSCDSTAFSVALDRFAKEKSPGDTVVLLLDYGDDVSLYNIVQAQEIIYNHFEKYLDHGTYYFSTAPVLKVVDYGKTDTLCVYAKDKMEYNHKALNSPDLKKKIKSSVPDLLIIRIDNTLPIQVLVDILKLCDKLKVRAILGRSPDTIQPL